MSSFELSPAMFGLLAITLSQMHVGPFMLDACGQEQKLKKASRSSSEGLVPR